MKKKCKIPEDLRVLKGSDGEFTRAPIIEFLKWLRVWRSTIDPFRNSWHEYDFKKAQGLKPQELSNRLMAR
jgi:hypothetical protein